MAKEESKKIEKEPSYTAKDIYVLEGLDPVRKDRVCISVQRA